MAFQQGGTMDFSGLNEEGGLEQSGTVEKLFHQLGMRYTTMKVSKASHPEVVCRYDTPYACLLQMEPASIGTFSMPFVPICYMRSKHSHVYPLT